MTSTSRRSLAAIVSVAALAALLPGTAHADPLLKSTGSAKVAPPVALPASPAGLPAPGSFGSTLDAAAPYQPQLMCAAKARVGIVKLRALALETYGRGGTSPAGPRACASGSQSEHKDGRAWDWMLNHANKQDRKVAADFLSWVTADNGRIAARLGIMYVIFNRKIWASYSPGWRSYTGADPHTSHIHISLSWNGARAHTSFWTGKTWPLDYGACQVFAGQPAVVAGKPRTTPCDEPAPTPQLSTEPLLWLGSTGATVGKAQRLLDVPVTRTFDRATRRAVLGYQAANELPRTGAMDDPTWVSLLPTSVKASKPVWTAAAAVRWAHRHGDPDIRVTDAGRRVYALQSALRMPAELRTSYYGRATRTAVLAAKSRLGLPKTARVTPALWAGLPLPTASR